MSTPADRQPWLFERAGRSPASLCIRWHEDTTTFSELAERAEALAGYLAGMGIGRGDRIAVLAPPCTGFVEMFHAVHRLAATLVPLPPGATTHELGRMLECASPQAFVFAQHLSANANSAVASLRSQPILWAADFRHSLCASGGATKGTTPAQAGMAADALHAIVFTSGTAGAYKGVMLSNANQEASARASARRLKITERDLWLACMPLHHIGGIAILVRNVVAGVGVVMHTGFNAGDVDRALREDGITMISLVPTMLARLLDAARGRPYPDRLRIVLTGGGPLDAGLSLRAHRLGLPIVPTYGLTEAASQVCTALPGTTGRPSHEPSTAGWSGLPLEGTTVEIDGAGEDGVGEIVVQAPTVSSGYFGDTQSTRSVFRDGRLHTGDLGRMCADGSLVVACRRTDLIVSGGENVYPGEVEAVLCSYPEVAQACVYAADDPQWGQAVHAAVVLQNTAITTEAAGNAAIAELLRKHCVAALSRFKVPRRFRFVASLPLTAGGKVARDAVARVKGDC